jgi:hypothetical protein
MVVLGPLIVLQYAFWRPVRGPERTTQRFLAEEGLRRREASPPSA